MMIHIVVLGNVTNLKDHSELHLLKPNTYLVEVVSTKDPRPESMQAPEFLELKSSLPCAAVVTHFPG